MCTSRSTLPIFENAYAANHGPLVRYLTRLTRCPARAEDLAQATWLKLLPRLAGEAWQARDATDLRAWLYAAARNLYLDEYTRKHGEARTCTVDPLDLDTRSDDDADPAALVERAERERHVRAAVAALPGEQRSVVLLWASGTPARQIAQAAAAPTDTVLSRKKYAFARMRRALAALHAPVAAPA